MSAETASLVVQIAGAYLALGALFALAFVARGAARVDPDAREASWGFRVVVFPGVTALWPLLALRWARGLTSPPSERNAHRDAAAERTHGDAPERDA